MDAGREPLERVYRDEATRIRAALAARTGDVGLAEDAVQDAFIEAIEHWPRDGVPANPGGWLATTARRKALDRLRRDRVGADKLTLLAATETWAVPASGEEAAGRPGDGGPLDAAGWSCRSGAPDAGGAGPWPCGVPWWPANRPGWRAPLRGASARSPR